MHNLILSCFTSGRALGFAGYGLVDSIATADEMEKAKESKEEDRKINGNSTNGKCALCFAPLDKPHASNCPAA